MSKNVSLRAVSSHRATFLAVVSVLANLGLILYSNLAVGAQVLSNVAPARRRSLQSATACNAADSALVDGLQYHEWGTMVTGCVLNCGLSALSASSLCIGDCMTADVGFSTSCANSCFNPTGMCGASKCLGYCLNGATPACLACIDDDCMPDLLTCTGFNAPNGSRWFNAGGDGDGGGAAGGGAAGGGGQALVPQEPLPLILYPILPDGEITFFYGVSRAIQGGAYAIVVAIVACSFIWPYLSILLFLTAWLVPLSDRGRLQLLGWVCRLDRWALMDVMIISVLVSYFNFDLFNNALAVRTESRAGICTFAISGLWSIVLGTNMMKHAAKVDAERSAELANGAAGHDAIHLGCCGKPLARFEAQLHSTRMRPLWFVLSTTNFLLMALSCAGPLVTLQLPTLVGDEPLFDRLTMATLGSRVLPSAQTTDVLPSAIIGVVFFAFAMGASLLTAALQVYASLLSLVFGLTHKSTAAAARVASALQPYATYDVFAIAFVITTKEYSLVVNALVAAALGGSDGSGASNIHAEANLGWGGSLLLPTMFLFWANALLTASNSHAANSGLEKEKKKHRHSTSAQQPLAPATSAGNTATAKKKSEYTAQLGKFCHKCGTPYVMVGGSDALFCFSCGEPRMRHVVDKEGNVTMELASQPSALMGAEEDEDDEDEATTLVARVAEVTRRRAASAKKAAAEATNGVLARASETFADMSYPITSAANTVTVYIRNNTAKAIARRPCAMIGACVVACLAMTGGALGLSEMGETALFTFHAKTSAGLFIPEGLGEMRALYDTLVEDARYKEYCYLVPSPADPTVLECETPRTPLQLYYGKSSGSRFDSVDLDVITRPFFNQISQTIAELGVAPLVLADKQGADALVSGCHTACTAPNATGDVCSTLDALQSLPVPITEEGMLEIQSDMTDIFTLAAASSAGASTSTDSEGSGSLEDQLESLGKCSKYAYLAISNQTDVQRVVSLHYSLSRLTLDEWLRPLPKPAESVMHDPNKVNQMVIQLFEQPSLSTFSALPRLFYEEAFGSARPIANVTRMLITYGAPRFGAPNRDGDRMNEHDLDFMSYFCDGEGMPCEGFANAYSAERSPSKWQYASPAFYINSPPWVYTHFLEIALNDLVRASAPFVVVFVVLLLFTRSLLLSLVGIFLILLSLGGSLFCLRIFLGGTWISVYVFPTVYIVIGVGADDLFFLIAAWFDEGRGDQRKLTAGSSTATTTSTSTSTSTSDAAACTSSPPADALVGRLGRVYRNAGEAILTTTLTSAAAFLSTMALSPIAAIKLFGFLTAVSLLFSYALVLTLFAGCLVWCERRRDAAQLPTWRKRQKARIGFSDGSSRGGPPPGPLEGDGVEMAEVDQSSVPVYTTPAPAAAASGSRKDEKKEDKDKDKDKSKETHALEAQAAPASSSVAPTSSTAPTALHKARSAFAQLLAAPIRFRYITLLAFACGVAPFCGYQLSKLEFDAYPPAILPPDHPLQRVIFDNALFGTSPLDVTETAHILWGLAPGALDLSEVNVLYNSSNVGEPIHEPGFKMDGPAQLHILRACDLLKANEEIVRTAPDLSTGEIKPMVRCWVDEFKAWRVANGETFPVEDADLAKNILLEWLKTDNGAPWVHDLGFKWDDNAGSYNLEWARVRADTKIKFYGLERRSTLEVYHSEWELMKDAINMGAPPSAMHALQVIGSTYGPVSDSLENKWIQLAMHGVYQSMSTSGLAIGLAVAFSILLIVTRSLTVALIAVISLVQVIMGVFASLRLIGWALGVIESLCLILVSGLSVDYVLHVACAYAQSDEINRVSRTTAAISRLSAPLLAGTMTTLISALSLCTCNFQILGKIGVFMVFTSIWSWTTAQTLLPALLATFGPEGGEKAGEAMGESGNDSDVEPVVASTPAAIDSVSSATAAHDLDSATAAHDLDGPAQSAAEAGLQRRRVQAVAV